MTGGRVGIILLNWNSWADTVECVASLLGSVHRDFEIIIVDNASVDGSVEKIREELRSMPGISGKALTVRCISEDEAHAAAPHRHAPRDVTIISNKKNYGFGGGNNRGLRYLLERGGFDYVWLLNNDTTVDKRALSALIAEAEKNGKAAFVGSVLRYHAEPGTVQAVGGGRFYPLIGLACLYMKNRSVEEIKGLKGEDAAGRINYLMGASILIRGDALADVGLFDEDFFLYAEELDLIHRAGKKGWGIAVAMDSHVFHKDSASTRGLREQYYYYLYKNNMLFLKKNYGWGYALASLLPSVLNLFRSTSRAANIKAALRGISEGIRFAVKGD